MVTTIPAMARQRTTSTQNKAAFFCFSSVYVVRIKQWRSTYSSNAGNLQTHHPGHAPGVLGLDGVRLVGHQLGGDEVEVDHTVGGIAHEGVDHSATGYKFAFVRVHHSCHHNRDMRTTHFAFACLLADEESPGGEPPPLETVFGFLRSRSILKSPSPPPPSPPSSASSSSPS